MELKSPGIIILAVIPLLQPTVGLVCSRLTLPIFEATDMIWAEEGKYAVYECDRRHFDPDHKNHYITWCDDVTGEWTVPERVTCNEGSSNHCEPNPCLNYGVCSTEDAYGWGFVCSCYGDYGGKYCHIQFPCAQKPCPPRTRYCIPSSSTETGRRCYDNNWVPVQ